MDSQRREGNSFSAKVRAARAGAESHSPRVRVREAGLGLSEVLEISWFSRYLTLPDEYASCHLVLNWRFSCRNLSSQIGALLAVQRDLERPHDLLFIPSLN